MNIGSITFSGIAEVKDTIIYNGVKCIYVDRGVDYWIQPISPTESINQLAGMGKAISKQDFNNLLGIKTTNQ